MPQSSPESGCVPPDRRVNVLLDECLTQAHALVAAIRAKISQGDASAEEVASLDALVRAIIRLAPPEPASIAEPTRKSLHDLFAAIQSIRQEGAAWIQQTALPELESLTRGKNGLNVYRQRSHPS
jgi:hypothetical protein